MSNPSPVNIMCFGHNGCLNRGCEAIVRSTSAILKNELDPLKITIASYDALYDQKLDIPYIDEVIQHNRIYKRYSFSWAVNLILRKVLRSRISTFKYNQGCALKEIPKADICFSIGGDNYCYGVPHNLIYFDRFVKKAGKKLVLWGASIEPSSIVPLIVEDLKTFDLITVRESLSYNALVSHGIYDNVKLVSDPAFAMESEEILMPDSWENHNMVGLNISPLIIKLEKEKGIVSRSVHRFIEHIIKNTPFTIALIPHVTWELSNDMKVLEDLHMSFKDTNRVILIDDCYTAPQYKYVISKCRFFIGARTHATIAAYSSCVPTIVLGYSVKSQGIALDIFGDTKGLVLPVQHLVDEMHLIEAFEILREREKEIQVHLTGKMQGYIENARAAAKYIKPLLHQIALER